VDSKDANLGDDYFAPGREFSAQLRHAAFQARTTRVDVTYKKAPRAREAVAETQIPLAGAEDDDEGPF